MLRIQITFITVLLVVLSGSLAETGVTALMLFCVTSIITFLCFNLRVRLDFEGVFKFFESLGIGEPTFLDPKEQEIDIRLQSPRRVSSNGLKDLPKPLARQLRRFIESVRRDFISSWYDGVGPREKQFVHEVETALEFVASETYQRMLDIDTHSVAVNLINMYRRHLKIFDECRAAVNQKYPGIPPKDFEKCIVELYEARVSDHLATKSQGAEMDYFRVLTDVLIFTVLPNNMFSCEGGRFMLREILAIQGFLQLVDLLTEPSFVNQALIDILVEPVPVDIIRQRWREAELAEEMIDQQECDQKEPSEVKETSFSEKSVADVDNLIEVPYDEYTEASDANDSKFATPKHSSSELSSDESFDAFHRVLRQNQLEAKSSAPVYGSTSVKLHDSASQVPVKYILPYGHQVHNNKQPVKSNAPSEAADSGILSIYQKPNTADTYLDTRAGNPSVYEEETTAVILSESQRFDCNEISDVENNIPLSSPNQVPLDSDLLESWTKCPSSRADFFRHNSFHTMYNKQDKISEQFKAKLGAVAVTCLEGPSCLQGQQLLGKRNVKKISKDLSHSLEGSATMEFPHSDDVGNSEGTIKDTSSNSSKDLVTKIHSVKGRNAFYEPASLCPTCVEMTMLANPHENGKFVPVMLDNSEDKKVTSHVKMEHDCGLSEAHFCNPETDTETVTPEIKDDASFVSCDDDTVTDLELSVESLASSGTLLASGESTDSSAASLYQPSGEFGSKNPEFSSTGSFDVLSLNGFDTDHSTLVESEGVQSVGSDVPDGLEVIKSRRKDRTPSVTTFKSVVDSCSLNHSEPIEFQTPRVGIEKTYLPSEAESPVRRKRKNTYSFQKTSVSSSPKIFKFFRERFAGVGRRSASTKRQSETRIQRTSESDFGSVKDWDVQSSPPKLMFLSSLSDSETGSVVSESRSTQSSNLLEKTNVEMPVDPNSGLKNRYGVNASETEFESNYCEHTTNIDNPLGELTSPAELNWNTSRMLSLVEEVGSEMQEDVEIYEDAHSNFDDPLLSPYVKSELSASKDSLTSDSTDIVEKFSPPNELGLLSLTRKGTSENSVMIPVYQGEVIVRNPSKIPASAWLYPIQMISIPGTEVAFEKGWEPGGNKYTLYSIHYDIRIWPDIYQQQILEASVSQSQDVSRKVNGSQSNDAVPLIREIKRRYREFIYLHNRLTHGIMSTKMKGILRPNRRYAMPFGRMDPDVIEGRRKILEYYLVSLVSRPDLCNSREFKEFLGAEGYGNVSFIKPRTVQPKMIFNRQMNKIISGIKTAFPSSSRDTGEKTESSQYFIHGYDTPRMFGYGDPDAAEEHCITWFGGYVETIAGGTSSSKDSSNSVVTTRVNLEHGGRAYDMGSNGTDVTVAGESLDKATTNVADLDLATCPQFLYNEDGEQTDRVDRRFSGSIAALFAEQLKATRLPEKISELDAEISKKPGESPWPLTDSVLALACQALKGYNSWITYEKVQQAILYGLGGIVEWLICRAIDDVLIEERWLKYLGDLYEAIWDAETDKLKEKKAPLSEEEQKVLKQEALEKLLDIIPSIIRISIGPSNYQDFGEGLLQSLQYKRINRHLLYAALEIVLSELIPEFQQGFQPFLSASSSAGARKPLK